jgi:hypothetical protein
MKSIRKTHGEQSSVDPPLVSFAGTGKHPGVHGNHSKGRDGFTETRIAVLMRNYSRDVINLRVQMHPPCLSVTDRWR